MLVKIGCSLRPIEEPILLTLLLQFKQFFRRALLAFGERPYCRCMKRRLSSLMHLGIKRRLSAPIGLGTVMIVGGMVMLLVVRGEFTTFGHGQKMDEHRQKYDIFGISSMVCQLGRKPFLVAATFFLILAIFLMF